MKDNKPTESKNMLSIEPKNLELKQIGKYLLGGVAPRPIAFVSTLSEEGVNNLSPFSFFNAFGHNPPVVAFSASRRVRNNTVKDTYNNLNNTGECVIHAVTYSMVEQVNLASCEFGADVDEFEKAGFTAVDSDIVKPKRVAESPFQMECKLMQMVDLGGKHGSGNLAICEIVKFHIANELIMDDGFLDPQMLDHVGRNGKHWYTRASGDAIFDVPKPGAIKGLGYQQLPDFMKRSHIYTANNLGRFGLVDYIPKEEEVESFMKNYERLDGSEDSFFRYMRFNDYKKMLSVALNFADIKHPKSIAYLEYTAKCAIENDNRDFAWKAAVFSGLFEKKLK